MKKYVGSLRKRNGGTSSQYYMYMYKLQTHIPFHVRNRENYRSVPGSDSVRTKIMTVGLMKPCSLLTSCAWEN